MKDRQYQSGLAQMPGFQPRKRPTYKKQRDQFRAQDERNQRMVETNIKENTATNVENLKQIQRDYDRDSQTVKEAIRQSDEATRLNIDQTSKDVEALAGFSKTLTDTLVKRQEKKNEEEKERGIMLAYTDGIPEAEAQQFDEDEASLRDTETATREVADRIEKNTDNVFMGERVRGLSGWAAYGYAIGKAQQGGGEYLTFLQTAQENTSVVIDTGNGPQEITLQTAKTPEEYAAVMSQIRSDFLQQYKDMNPALLNKYLFPSMRETELKRQLDWQKERTAEIKAERQTAANDTLYQGLQGDNPGQALLTYIETTASDAGGRGAARTTAVEIIKTGIKNGTIKREDVEALMDAEFTARDGSRQTVGKYWREFGSLLEELDNELINDRNREDGVNAVGAKEFADNAYAEIRQREAQGDYLTEDQKQELLNQSRDLYGQVDPRLEGLRTQQQVDNEDLQELLTAKQQAGLPITAADLRNASPEVYRQWASQIKEDAGAYALSSQESQTATAEIKSTVSEKLGQQEAGTEKSPKWQRVNRRAQAFFDYEYRQASLSASSKEEAYQIAMAKTLKAIQSGGFQEEYSAEANQEYGQIVAGGKRTLGEWAAAGNLANISSVVIPGTEDEVKKLEQYANGTGDIPPIYTQLASGLKDVSAFDLARAQYMAATGKDLVPPAAEQIASEQEPWFQRLLKFRPTSARTRQAMVGSGDRRFLDMVASVESDGSGGYDAYNTGGADGGRTAYGSGNSAEDNRFGAPVSQLSLGEIMKLQANGQLHAAGRYQFIGPTFKEVVAQMGLPPDTIFDGATQDRMAMHRARWRVNRYGLSSLSQEWIGLEKVPQAQINAAYLSADPYNNPDVLTPGVRQLAYITDDIGDTSTGEHLDVKSVDGQRFHYRALDKYVEVDDPEFGMVPLGDIRERTNFVGDSWDEHVARQSTGIDYGTATGSQVFVKNGAKVISSVPTEHGDLTTIELPNGRQFTFLHGRAPK